MKIKLITKVAPILLLIIAETSYAKPRCVTALKKYSELTVSKLKDGAIRTHNMSGEVVSTVHKRIIAYYNFSKLLIAIREGNVLEVEQILLSNTIDINTISPLGDMAIIEAVSSGDENVFALLLKSPDINVNIANHAPPISVAIKRKQSAIIEMLLARSDLDLSVKNKYGDTPLMFAVASQDINIVKSVLEKDSSIINEQNEKGETALIMAVRKNLDKIVYKLLDTPDINLDLQDNKGNTALELYSKGSEIFNFLYNEHKKRKIDTLHSLHTQKEQEATIGDTEVIVDTEATMDTEVVWKIIEDPRLDRNIKNKIGQNILMVATKNGNISLVQKLLLEPGELNINDVDDHGDSTLILATEAGNVDIVSMLLEAGADLDIQNEMGNTALMVSIKHGYIDISKQLINHGADINIQNNHKKSAFIIASAKGYNEIIEMLLEHDNLDVNIQDNNGNTALMTFVENKVLP